MSFHTPSIPVAIQCRAASIRRSRNADGNPGAGATCIQTATSPDNVVGGKSYSVAAPVRFCTDSTRATCHAKRSTASPGVAPASVAVPTHAVWP